MIMKRRVVITGLGAVTPLGLDVKETWAAICAGKSGIGRIARFDAEALGLPTRIAAEVRGFDPLATLERKDARKTDRFIQLALTAAVQAVIDAGLKITPAVAPRIGTIVGTGMGGVETIEEASRILVGKTLGGYEPKAWRKLSPFTVPMAIPNMAAGQISIRLGLKGPNACVSTACASGAHAIGDSFKLIQRGACDAMVAGGSEAAVTPLGIGAFCAMRAMSTRNDTPETASRPFDRTRDGFVMGEGAGIVVLEELDAARARGARIYAEMTGYGLTGDAYHITSPPEDSDGTNRCMRMALEDAGIEPTQVAYVNAHGTATAYNDGLESRSIKEVFGEHAYRLAVSSTKSMTGHLLGGAGGIETIFTALALRDGILPPTMNLTDPDDDCDLDYVPGAARPRAIGTALTNSFGFGGTNACLVLGRFEEGGR
jgi:3-oxoacyl-[acyl-carrier-protein] synthase II